MPVSLSGIIHHSHSFTRLKIYHHIYFIKDLVYTEIFDEWFFDFTDASTVRILKRSSGLEVIGFNEANANAIARPWGPFNFLNNHDPKLGIESRLLINDITANSDSTVKLIGTDVSGVKSIIGNFENTLPFFGSFTFFASIKLTVISSFLIFIGKKDMSEKAVMIKSSFTVNGIKIYVGYGRVTTGYDKKMTLTSDFASKLLTLWVSYDQEDRELTIGVSNYAAQVTISNFDLRNTRKFFLMFNLYGKIARLGLTDNHYAWMSPNHNKLILAEKSNGAYFLSG